MKGKFQAFMLFVIVVVQSFFITMYFDKIDSTISVVGMLIFFLAFYLYFSMLNENNPIRNGGRL